MSKSNAVMKNTALHDLLLSIQPKVKKAPRKEVHTPYPVDPNSLGEDGTDHTNIGPYCRTEIGKALANETPIPINHEIFGRFRCVTGFWYYIKSKERDDRCRKLIGRSLKDFSKGLSLSEVKNFRAIILDTVWTKIQQNPAIKDGLIANELPFDCYFENRRTGLRQRPNYFAWFLEGITEIRNAILEDRKPNFDRFLDDKKSKIYDFALSERILNNANAADTNDSDLDETTSEIKELLSAHLLKQLNDSRKSLKKKNKHRQSQLAVVWSRDGVKQVDVNVPSVNEDTTVTEPEAPVKV